MTGCDKPAYCKSTIGRMANPFARVIVGQVDTHGSQFDVENVIKRTIPFKYSA